MFLDKKTISLKHLKQFVMKINQKRIFKSKRINKIVKEIMN